MQQYSVCSWSFLIFYFMFYVFCFCTIDVDENSTLSAKEEKFSLSPSEGQLVKRPRIGRAYTKYKSFNMLQHVKFSHYRYIPLPCCQFVLLHTHSCTTKNDMSFCCTQKGIYILSCKCFSNFN